MTKKDADMFGLKQTGGKAWSARLTIPRDRQRDVGEAFGTKSGTKQDAIMSLQTRDKNEAIQRRGAALEALRSQVNEKLAAIGKPPLEGDWRPRTVTERAVNDALLAKKAIEEASTAYSPDRNADGTVNENVPTNEQDNLHHVLTSQAEDVAESLSDEEPDAPLFPECPPGGADHKRGWTFSKHFLRYRHQIMGEEGNGTDFHSTRRCFATFMETALANGAAACTELVCDHLIGHKSERLAANTYAAKRFDWSLYSEAILGMVDKGVPERVKEALSG